MRRSGIKLILKLTKKFYNSIIAQTPQKQETKRGRPRKYSADLLILQLAIIKEMLSASLRETLYIAKDYFDQVLP